MFPEKSGVQEAECMSAVNYILKLLCQKSATVPSYQNKSLRIAQRDKSAGFLCVHDFYK